MCRSYIVCNMCGLLLLCTSVWNFCSCISYRSVLTKSALGSIAGQYCGSRSGNMDVTSSRKRDFLRGTDYVLIYEDHEGDFMLVGDVPWQ